MYAWCTWPIDFETNTSLNGLCVAGFAHSVSNAAFGLGQGVIILDNVECVGTEETLLGCRGNEPGIHNCGHTEDTGVYWYCPGVCVCVCVCVCEREREIER